MDPSDTDNEQKPISVSDLNDIEVVDEDGSPIDMPIPDEEQLSALREHIKNLSPEDRRTFLQNMANMYNVNPQGQQYSPASNKTILKEKLRRKQMQLRAQRSGKSAQQMNQLKNGKKKITTYKQPPSFVGTRPPGWN